LQLAIRARARDRAGFFLGLSEAANPAGLQP
jgi:hypothetical protein